MTPIKGKDDLMPAQEKLEWVTPKISLMDAGDTGGKPTVALEGAKFQKFQGSTYTGGPS